ncbi:MULTISPECIES: OFA family MFS transporter [unclassified Paenibacillus]|uniref:L-lactate MFS transporter n=1 Tax=unclassified Paenibacillus TaxID=185978 RepID=UPI002475470C|nr:MULTISPECIES: OFA family MFS transporter [unclassified Paenibacillus]MDH6429411.1 OFA family oxalate/formate antiporter-like MFS transporter [Paenibacillus sp. PastH-4]MDH6445619.1 OFA family oxalate/formate antiporter-like MFS transporter [Paenibacillus sp. PastF-4]MDH6529506.1 OFA family oxalate/formate antiporter-like MFS transporter [Paenibacillus sp. PastH-3]
MTTTMDSKSTKRWLIVLGTVIMQMGLGTIYTWSLFNAHLVTKFGWELNSVSITFSITSFALAFATLFAGKLQDRFGLRRLTATAGIVLGLGLILSSQANSLFMFYLLVGVIVGFADGTAYITSLSNLIKWFPNNKGLISGVSVGAYGTGSLIFKYINGGLIDSVGVSNTFMYWGLIVMGMIVIGSLLVREAPVQAAPTLAGSTTATVMSSPKDYTVKEMLRTKEAYLLFIIFFTACMCGLYLIGIVKDIGVQLAELDVQTAASAVAMIAIFNTAGRLILGALSDKMSRLKLVGASLAVTAAAMLTLSYATLNFGLFFTCVAAIAFCFGGNITVFPAIVSDFFGLKNHSKNYGIVYQGFGIGALSGSFIAVILGGFKPTFVIFGLLCLLACIIAVSLKPPVAKSKEKKALRLKATERTA